MLSPSDFKEKHIIVIKNPCDIETRVKFQNENVVYQKENGEVQKFSCHRILALFIIGNTSLTTVFIRKAVQYGISIFFLTDNLSVYTTLNVMAEGNYELRRRQYLLQNDFEISKQLVKNKIDNQLHLIKKDKKISAEFKWLEKYRQDRQRKLERTTTDKELLGLEGSASKTFFHTYFAELDWYKRMPRVKCDINNLLLDVGYTYLINYIDSLLRLYGFDVYKGFYHKLFFKRKSLACDIMEPFRCVIEKQLLKSFRLKQIDKKDFIYDNDKYVLRYDRTAKYSKIFLNAIMDNKQDIYYFIQDFYSYIAKDQSCEFPYFKIK